MASTRIGAAARPMGLGSTSPRTQPSPLAMRVVWAFMFLCKLLLGAEGPDHTWVDEAKYYVVKQSDGLYQALPVYLVQFQASERRLVRWLGELRHHEMDEEGTLKYRQRGGQSACEARRDAGMEA